MNSQAVHNRHALSLRELAEHGYEESHLAWAYLSRVCEGPQGAIFELLEQGHEIAAIAHAVGKRESWIGPLLKATAARYQQDLAALDISRIIKLGGRMICPEDAEYQELNLESAFYFAQQSQFSDRNDVYPPHALWVIGAPLPPITRASVSIVGSRNHSSYGTKHTTQIVHDLVVAHHAIISGGALGIDAVAHQECLRLDGHTIAVFAGGLDALYPRSNAAIFRQIPEKGALVSEYPPGFSAQRHRFLTRNRLVAALSRGTVVIEAGYRSGALNTLNWAAALAKVPMALPGPVDSAFSRGCHERLRHHEAELVLDGADILELINPRIEQLSLELTADTPRPIPDLSESELRIFDAVSIKPRTAQEIATNAGCTLGLTMHLLVELEQRGLLQRSGARWAKADAIFERA